MPIYIFSKLTISYTSVFYSFSLSSLSRLSESGTKNKKAKMLIQQLEIDKRLLEDRVRDLTERNQRGR